MMPANRSLILTWLRVVGNFIICTSVLAGAAAAVVMINRTEPTAEQVSATRKSSALVETITVERSTYRPTLVVLGTVTAAQDIVLSSRVSGPIIDLSETFVPGQRVTKNELLLQIDPADFEQTLAIRESELEQVEASLKIEEGRGELAKKELELLQDTIETTNPELVLRIPQIESIRAEVKGAEASVKQAELDLERTRILAPFDAQIIRRSVNVGSQVGPGDELARLVGIEEYWIMAAVPVRSLRWIQFPELDGESSAVRLLSPGIWLAGAERHAEVARMIGTLDEQTRLARVLITVQDPLSIEGDGPPLILDTLVETRIEGRPIENVVRISRAYVRENDTVWVMKNDQLEIREPLIVFRDADYAYISEGLEDGDEVVTTNLATVAAGIGLKKANTENGSSDEERDESGDEAAPDDESADQSADEQDAAIDDQVDGENSR